MPASSQEASALQPQPNRSDVEQDPPAACAGAAHAKAPPRCEKSREHNSTPNHIYFGARSPRAFFLAPSSPLQRHADDCNRTAEEQLLPASGPSRAPRSSGPTTPHHPVILRRRSFAPPRATRPDLARRLSARPGRAWRAQATRPLEELGLGLAPARARPKIIFSAAVRRRTVEGEALNAPVLEPVRRRWPPTRHPSARRSHATRGGQIKRLELELTTKSGHGLEPSLRRMPAAEAPEYSSRERVHRSHSKELAGDFSINILSRPLTISRAIPAPRAGPRGCA